MLYNYLIHCRDNKAGRFCSHLAAECSDVWHAAWDAEASINGIGLIPVPQVASLCGAGWEDVACMNPRLKLI